MDTKREIITDLFKLFKSGNDELIDAVKWTIKAHLIAIEESTQHDSDQGLKTYHKRQGGSVVTLEERVARIESALINAGLIPSSENSKTETKSALLKRIEVLENRDSTRRVPSPKEKKKPVNQAAYNEAVTALVHGNRRPLVKYMSLYRVPGT